jgi:hypothetical protein
MSVNYYIKNSVINKVDTRLFDIRSTSTRYGKDLELNVLGTVDRIVGLDKLQQQTEKVVLLSKGTYSGNPLLGTDLLNSTRKDTMAINSDIRDSLSSYAAIQQGKKDISTLNILGRNIYRTVDIEDTGAWKKLNDHIITINEFSDNTPRIDTFYYYGITTVYRDTSNRTKETQIISYKSASVSNEDTMNAKVDEDFILISGNNKVTLYWNLPIDMTYEEQLRSIVSIRTTKSPSDPRKLTADIKLSNRDLTESQITAIGA